MRQRPHAVLDEGALEQHLAVDIIVLVSFRQRRVGDAGHLRGVLADEVSRVGDIEPLLQHVVDPLEVGGEQIHMREPRVVAVEFGAEPCVHAGQLVARLRDVDVQQRVVDTLRKEAVAARFDQRRMASEIIPGRSVGLGRHLALAVDVGARRSGAVLDVAQRTLAPELAADLVRLPAVLQELARIAPVAVVLQPQRQSVLVRNLAQAADMRIGQLVGRHAAHVPQEAVGDLLAADYHAVVNGQERQGVVAELIPEIRKKRIREVLSAFLVAVGHHHTERFPVFGGYAAQHLADKGVEMVLQVGRSHLVHLEARSLGRRGRVLHPRGTHSRAHDDPVARRGFPHQAVAVEAFRYIDYFRGIDSQRRIVQHGLVAPLVLLPVRQRRLEHLGEGLLGVTLHTGFGREQHLLETRIPARTPHYEPELAARDPVHADCNRCIGVEPDLDVGIRAVDFERRDRPVAARLFRQQLDRRPNRTVSRPHGDIAQVEVGVSREVERDLRRTVENHLRRRVAVNQVLQFAGLGCRCDAGVGRRQRPARVRRTGVGDNPHVLEIGGGFLQQQIDLAPARNALFHRGQVTHRLLRPDPRASGLAPAGTVEHSDFNPQLRSFLERRMGNLPPFVRKEPDGSVRRRHLPEADVADKCAVDAHALHRLEVFLHTRLGYVARKPVPVDRGLYRVGRRDEPGRKCGAGSAGSRAVTCQRQERQRQQEQFR